jgi:tRNA(His) 5'-end guanylyltransferase
MSEDTDNNNTIPHTNTTTNTTNAATTASEAQPLINPSIYDLLLSRPPPIVSGIDKDFYEFGPDIPRHYWDKLGAYISSSEHLPIMKAPNDQHITLRLDIRSMSGQRNRFLQLNILTEKFDKKFAEMMISVTKALAEHYNTKLAYTQSDEITLILSPPPPEENLRNTYTHPFSGKRDKLCSLAASLASSTANRILLQLYLQTNKRDEKQQEYDFSAIPLVQFDCRMACWNSYLDALQVILWRSYDTGVNGISDAIHHRDKSKSKLNRIEKLLFLLEEKLLPLDAHQCYGTLIYKTRVKRKRINPKNNEAEEYERRCFVHSPVGNIHNLLKNNNWVLS